MNWFNSVASNQQWASPLDPKDGSVHLFSNDESIKSIQAKGDILIGNYVGDSNQEIPVTHVQVATNDDNDFKANTSTEIAAHWWYQDKDGKWTLGYQPLAKPSQSEGISLVKSKVGNNFNITVSMPDGGSYDAASGAYSITGHGKTVKYYFVNADDVAKELTREIVGSTDIKQWDPTIQNDKVSVGYQIFDTKKPVVHVTQTVWDDHKKATYQIKIDGDYVGFRKDQNPGAQSAYPSTLTLISWAPDNAYDLFPDPHDMENGDTDTPIHDFDSDQIDWIEKHFTDVHHVGGVSINHDLIKLLEAHPWSAKVTTPDSDVNLLLPDNTPANQKNIDQPAGYEFVKNGTAIYYPGKNVGITWPGDEPVIQTHTVRQEIHYYYGTIDENGKLTTTGQVNNDPTVKEVQFFQKDGDTTWYAVTPSTALQHDNLLASYFSDDNNGFPKDLLVDYTAYLAKDDPNGWFKNGDPITTIGYMDPFKYDGQHYLLADSDKTDPSYYVDLEKQYRRISSYDSKTDTFIINVVLVKNKMATATLRFVDVTDPANPVTLGDTTTVRSNSDDIDINFPNGETTLNNYLKDQNNKQKYVYVGTYLTGNPNYTNAPDLVGDDNYQNIASHFGKFSTQAPKNFVIALRHATEEETETKAVDEVIHYYHQGTTTRIADDYHASKKITFTRQVTKDLVTGKVIKMTEWAIDGEPQYFDSVDSPKIVGYKTETPKIDAITMDANQLKQISEDKFVKDSDGVPTYTIVKVVYYDPQTENVEETKDVNETIHYIYENGSVAAPDYKASPIKFTRKGIKNLATGETTWDVWTPGSNAFAAHKSPDIAGYTPDLAEIDTQSVNVNSKDLDFTVIYRAQNTPNIPDKTPDKPKPTTPEQPVTPTTPEQPVTPTTPDTPKQTVTTAKQKAAQLPQTGNSHSDSLLALAALSFLALFGLGNLDKRH